MNVTVKVLSYENITHRFRFEPFRTGGTCPRGGGGPLPKTSCASTEELMKFIGVPILFKVSPENDLGIRMREYRLSSN